MKIVLKLIFVSKSWSSQINPLANVISWIRKMKININSNSWLLEHILDTEMSYIEYNMQCFKNGKYSAIINVCTYDYYKKAKINGFLKKILHFIGPLHSKKKLALQLLQIELFCGF